MNYKDYEDGSAILQLRRDMFKNEQTFESILKFLELNEIPWLYVGTGHTLIDISAEEVVDTLKKNLPEK